MPHQRRLDDSSIRRRALGERSRVSIRRRSLRRAAALLALAVAAQGETPAPRGGQARVETSDERLARVQERRKALERELARLRGQERTLLGEVERLELVVLAKGQQLEETRLVLQRANAQLAATLRRAGELKQSIDATRPQLAAHARALYKLGELSYLRVLLSVDSPSDMFRGYRFVTALARRDNQRIVAFRSDLRELTAAQAELEQRTREAQALRAELERTRRALDLDRRRKTELLTQIVERKETHVAYVAELEEAERRLGELLLGLAAGEVSVPLVAFKGALPWPVSGRVRVPFGRRKHARFETYTIQNGVEIEAEEREPVAAVHDGTVVFADHFRGYGLMVVLDHGGKHHSLYAHLDELRVALGQKVAAGMVIATVGAGLEGPGLYFEIRSQGRPEDPLGWLRKPQGL
jgi:septal ring factor EnvC (AmiA/AmiB activator)